MCYTVNINLTRNQLEQRFGARFTEPSSFRPGYYFNAFEIPDLPVIQVEDPESIGMLKWGLIPFWVRDAAAAEDIRRKTFNARMETILEKPSFRESAKSRRCLVLCKGFYEWQQRDKEKIPHYIYLQGEPPIAMAGLYENWTDRETGEMIRTCTIITTAANSMMEKIHNTKKRMPLILGPGDEKFWIDPDLSPEKAYSYLKPVAAEQMAAHTISKLITKRGVDKNVPELVQPVSYENDSLFPL
ncbi:SOS response-associated peptidase [Bacteroidota bacterium]